MSNRPNQAKFRKILLKGAQRCEATLCELLFALDIAHIKPYHLCNEEEKKDPHNLLLLTASVHRVFDAGYVSFDETGNILISYKFDQWELPCIGLKGNERIAMPGRRNLYLKYHRENIFKNGTEYIKI